MSERLPGIYTRLGINNASVTPSEIILLVRDFSKRIKRIEEICERLEEITTDRGGTNKVSKRKVSTS
jgi:hypothetical protein